MEDDARDYIIKRAISKDYGGREIERIIDGEVKPLFVSEILFGSLKNGGDTYLVMKEGKPALDSKKPAKGKKAVRAKENKSDKKKSIDTKDLLGGKKKVGQKVRRGSRKDEEE